MIASHKAPSNKVSAKAEAKKSNAKTPEDWAQARLGRRKGSGESKRPVRLVKNPGQRPKQNAGCSRQVGSERDRYMTFQDKIER